MEKTIKKISPAILGIALICFFLPWINISCQGEKVATYTGIQLVTGTTIEQKGMFGEKKVEKVDAEPLAIATLICVIVGLGLSFLKGRKSAIAPAIVSAGGLVLLLLLKSKITNDILREGGGVIQVGYSVGFWLTLLFIIFAIGLNAFLFSWGKIHTSGTEP